MQNPYARLERESVVEVIKDRFFFATRRTQPNTTEQANVHFFTIDTEMVYEAFFADFGPYHIGGVYRFCNIVERKLTDPRLAKKRIYLYTSYDACKRTNAAFLVGAYAVLCLKKSPEEAFAIFEGVLPGFLPFRDASVAISTFNITILDCLRAISKAVANGFFHLSSFDLAEYEHFEKVENGDMNWIIPGKFIAFSGPTSVRIEQHGIRLFSPDDYVPLFKKFGVAAVVRLNKKEYDRVRFTSEGIEHHDLFFADGSAPSEAVVKRFLEIAEATPTAIAVHCRAGLGRTGTLIAAYIIKHFHFTATEAIAWVRLCRPGSIIGPQQHFLQQLQPKLWRYGEMQRRKSQQSTRELAPTFEDLNSISKEMKSLSVSNYSVSQQPTHRYELRERTLRSATNSSSYSNSSSSQERSPPKVATSGKLTSFTSKSSTLKRTKAQTISGKTTNGKATLAQSPSITSTSSIPPRNTRHSLSVVAISTRSTRSTPLTSEWISKKL